MRLPVWLILGIAVLAFGWGGYRIRIGLRTDEADRTGKRGLRALTRRTHVLFGIVYLLLGAALVSAALGWNPLGSLFAPGADAPPTAPAVPVELPPAKP